MIKTDEAELRVENEADRDREPEKGEMCDEGANIF